MFSFQGWYAKLDSTITYAYWLSPDRQTNIIMHRAASLLKMKKKKKIESIGLSIKFIVMFQEEISYLKENYFTF